MPGPMPAPRVWGYRKAPAQIVRGSWLFAHSRSKVQCRPEVFWLQGPEGAWVALVGSPSGRRARYLAFRTNHIEQNIVTKTG